MQPRRDSSFKKTNISPYHGFRNQKNAIIFVRETSDKAESLSLASKNLRKKIKRKNKIDVLPGIAE